MKVYKAYCGWTAESYVQLEGDRWIKFLTMKRSNGTLGTIAQAITRSGYLESFVLFRDFNKLVASTTPKRITQKLVEAQHAAIDFDAVLEEARDFYAAELA